MYKKICFTLSPRRLSHVKAIQEFTEDVGYTSALDFALITTLEHYNLMVKDPGYTIVLAAYMDFPFLFEGGVRYDVDKLADVLREVYTTSTIVVEKENHYYRRFKGDVIKGGPMLGKKHTSYFFGMGVAVLREDGVQDVAEAERVVGIMKNVVEATNVDK